MQKAVEKVCMCENCNYLCRVGHEVVVAECRTQKASDVQSFLVIFLSGSLEISSCNVLAKSLSLSLCAFSGRWLSHATKRSTRRSKSRRDSRRPSQHEIISPTLTVRTMSQLSRLLFLFCCCSALCMWYLSTSLRSNHGSNFEAY